MPWWRKDKSPPVHNPSRKPAPTPEVDPADLKVALEIDIPGPGMTGSTLSVTPRGERTTIYHWRDDDFLTANDVQMHCNGFDVGDHRDHDAIPGCFIFQLAGGTHRSQELNRVCFAPPNRVLLVKDPSNSVDPNAIAVWDLDRRSQAGYVPTALNRKIGADMGDDPLTALIILEWKRGRTRVSLTLLVGAGT